MPIKTQEAKNDFPGNPGHNIPRYFDVWQNFCVTRSEKNRDY